MLVDTLLYVLSIPFVGGLCFLLVNRFNRLPLVALPPLVMVPGTYIGVRGIPAFPPVGAGEWFYYALLVSVSYPLLEFYFSEWKILVRALFTGIMLGSMVYPAQALGTSGLLTIVGFSLPALILWYGLSTVEPETVRPFSICVSLTVLGTGAIVGYSSSFFMGQLTLSILFSLLPVLLLSSWLKNPLLEPIWGAFCLVFLGIMLFTALFTSITTYVCFLFLMAPVTPWLISTLTGGPQKSFAPFLSIGLTIVILFGALALSEPQLFGLSESKPESKSGSYRPY